MLEVSPRSVSLTEGHWVRTEREERRASSYARREFGGKILCARFPIGHPPTAAWPPRAATRKAGLLGERHEPTRYRWESRGSSRVTTRSR